MSKWEEEGGVGDFNINVVNRTDKIWVTFPPEAEELVAREPWRWGHRAQGLRLVGLQWETYSRFLQLSDDEKDQFLVLHLLGVSDE